jgi:hypothetical protein
MTFFPPPKNTLKPGDLFISIVGEWVAVNMPEWSLTFNSDMTCINNNNGNIENWTYTYDKVSRKGVIVFTDGVHTQDFTVENNDTYGIVVQLKNGPTLDRK